MIYEGVKRLAKRIVPIRFLIKYEVIIRKCLYLFYRGGKYQCNICNHNLRKFIRLRNNDLICPVCGSLSRNRRLWSILSATYLMTGISVLDFSPSRSIYRKLKQYPEIDYVPTDYAGEFIADQHYDITRLSIPDHSFDLIICYHILEHIEDDRKAMNELYRILKTGGVCLIQTPFREGEIYEDNTIKNPEERLKHFGQHDHVRIYSVEGLTKRLTRAGFSVSVKEFHERTDNLNGFQQHEILLSANK